MEGPSVLEITEPTVEYVTGASSFGRICRTCLTEQGELRSLFQDRLDEMLISCAAVQVDVNDGLPTQICSQCVLHVSRAYNFKQQAESSDSTLRQYISNFNSTESLSPDVLEINYTVNELPVDIPDDADDLLDNDSNSQFFVLQENGERNDELKNDFDESVQDKVHDESKELFEDKIIFYDNAPNMDNLLEDNIQEDKQEIVCKICSYVCMNDQEFKDHSKSHIRPKEHTCGQCGKSFHYKVGLRTHMRTHGIGEKKHECNDCGKKFYEPSELTIHIRSHTGERPIVCESCGKSFADPRSLAKHNKIHTGIKKYECDVCQKRFIHSYTLTAHKRTHTGEKPFVCSTCGHACATSTQLTLHTRTHTREKPYACRLCDKAFASRSGLSTHLMTHTGERRYICTICGKGARTSTDLASHIRTHTGEKPFQCKMLGCTKRYKTHSQLSAHMRTHTDSLLRMTFDTDSNGDFTEETSGVTWMDDFNKLSDEEFKSHFRLSKTNVEMLITEIGSAVMPRNPRRPAVHVKTAILLFLWTLTHDESFRMIARRFEIGQGHAHRVFIAMCTAMAKKQRKFIEWPRGQEITDTIQGYRDLGSEGLPDIIGSVDYIHIPIPSPSGTRSYQNQFGFCSIILQAVCNARLEFTDIHIDNPGGTENPWIESPIYGKLTKENIIPENCFIVAGQNYERSNLLLVPSHDYDVILEEKFMIKNAFELLKTNFKRIQFVKVQKIEYAKSIIVSACILHNICLRQNYDYDLTDLSDEGENVMYLIDEDDKEAMAIYGQKSNELFIIEHERSYD